MVFVIPHFTAEPNLTTTSNASNSDNICRGVSLREQDMGLGTLHLKKLLFLLNQKEILTMSKIIFLFYYLNTVN